MDYQTASKIVAEVAPDLHVGPNTGMNHINVHVTTGEPGSARMSPAFSIMLPQSTDAMPMEPEDEQVLFIQSIQSAKAHFGA